MPAVNMEIEEEICFLTQNSPKSTLIINKNRSIFIPTYINETFSPIMRQTENKYNKFINHLPQWKEILSINVRVIACVPKEADDAYSKALDCVIKYFNANNNITATKIMLMFQIAVLCISGRTGKRHWRRLANVIITRCK